MTLSKILYGAISAAFAACTVALFVAACGAGAAAFGAAACVAMFTVTGAAFFATLAFEA